MILLQNSAKNCRSTSLRGMYFDDMIHIYIAEFSQKFDMKNIVIRYNDLVRIEVCLPGTKYHVTVHEVRICLTF